jgi:PhzF family phenazine biosynthesis protein
MNTYPIYQVDAFTNRLFHGNPAAVVPLKHWLPDATMQRIAMENNLAETAFFVPLIPYDNNGAGYHIRWFTPELEIDLCGHATVATASVISQVLKTGEEEIIFNTQRAGQLKVTVNDDWYLLDFPSRMPEAVEYPDALLQALGVTDVAEVLKSRDYFVVLKDEAAVRDCRPDMRALKELDTLGIIITAKGENVDAVSRFFAPGAGVDEDPVTGSSHCNLIPYWSKVLGKKDLVFRQISARGGELVCENRGDRVIIGGQAVLYLKGEIMVPAS